MIKDFVEVIEFGAPGKLDLSYLVTAFRNLTNTMQSSLMKNLLGTEIHLTSHLCVYASLILCTT